MDSGLTSLVLVVLLASAGVLGDYFIKLSGGSSKYIVYGPFFVGMIIYALTAVGWFYAMKHIKLGALGILYSLTTVVLLTVVGAVFFGEQLNGYDWAGICFGILSIVFLSRFW